MKIFAHRGLSSLYPENTILAFEKALEYKIDGVETDVQLTKDNKAVIIHDEMLDRTTGVHGFVKDFTLEEIKKLNANNKKEGVHRIPTLDEFLDLFVDRKDLIINLELKTSIFEYEGIEEIVYDSMKKHNLLDNIIISSFNHESLLRFKKIDESIKTAVLTADRIVNVEEYVKSLGCSAYHPLFATVKKDRIDKAHSLGLDVNVWTIDDEMYLNMVKQMGVDTVMTNCCNKFSEKL